MNELLYIIWNLNPEMFSIPFLDRAPRWYGLLFASGFILGQIIVTWIYTKENKDPNYVDQLTIYLVVSTIIGARLGHCLFYDPDYYLSNPIKILMIWEGGLASHGAVFTIPALYIFSKKYKKSFLWLLDVIAIVVCLAGTCIRLGNFTNSEIIGLPTNNNNGVVFARDAHDILKYRFGERVDKNFFFKMQRGIRKYSKNQGPHYYINIKYKDRLLMNHLKIHFSNEKELKRYIWWLDSNISKHYL